MNNWSVTTLGDLAPEGFQNGIYKHGSLYGQGVPIVRINDFDNEGKFTTTNLQRVSISPDEMQRYKLQVNDILINRVNSLSHIGKSVIVRNLDEITVYESNMMRLRLEDSNARPAFIAYLLQSSATRNYFRTVAKKAVAQASINQDDLKQIEILLPPPYEQHKIAEILSTWDEAIDLTEQLITAKQKRKQALMQQLLTGEARFPRFIESSKKQETSYGDLPADWRYSPIDAIAEQCNMANLDRKQLPVLSCTKHEGLVDSLEYFGRKMFSDDLSTYKIVRQHQFAYATNHIEEGSIGYQNQYDAALISPMYTVFETDKKSVVDHFLYKVLKTEKYRQIFELNTNGSVNRRGSLRWKEFSKIHVPLPSIEEQEQISSVLGTCDEELSLLQQKLDALRLQKKGLMQQLLTGKIRVKPTPPQPSRSAELTSKPNKGGSSHGES